MNQAGHADAARVAHRRPRPLVAASVLLHVAAATALLLRPDAWVVAIGAIACNHLVLTLAGLLPRSSLLGPNWTRLPGAAAARGEVALTIDDGPDPLVTPQVLDILDRYRAKASFFCIGDAAIRHPDLCREIARRGHAVENHSQRHSRLFALFGPWRLADDVDRGRQTLLELTGEASRFFRPTAGLRSVLLEPVLAQRNLQLATWTRRGFDTQDGDADRVFRRLVRDLRGGDILLLHDGNAARTPAGVPVIVEVLPRLLATLRNAGLHPVTLRSVSR
jgi:peptidoglycan/xylan/chitin deacetylase (PgdA/CDA1 family)